MSNMTEQERQARQDAKDAEAQEKAYNKAMVNTPPAPKSAAKKAKGGAVKYAKGGVVSRGQGAVSRTKKCKMS